MIHYLLGYGSLITKESRYNTSITGKCLPVKLNNYKRYWNARINKNKKKYTAVSIEYSPDSKINAIITVINKDDLPFYDKREQNYERIRIKNSDIRDYETNKVISNKAIIWTYKIKPRFNKLSSYKYPILQSYIDLILTGCNRISYKFMVDFINSTSNWSNTKDNRYNWVNDRKKPVYNFNCNELCHKKKLIDSLLKYYKPFEYNKIKYMY